MNKGSRIAGVAFLIVGTAILVSAIYIMVRRLGLNPDLDFGAGAYYYADIPEYEKKLDWDSYTAQLPGWIYYALFFAWGAVVWFVLKRIEKKK